MIDQWNRNKAVMFFVRDIYKEWQHYRRGGQAIHVNPGEGDLVDVYGHVTEVTLLYVRDEHDNVICFDDLLELAWYQPPDYAVGCYSMAVFMDETWRYRW